MKKYKFFGKYALAGLAMALLLVSPFIPATNVEAGSGDYYASDQIRVTEVNEPQENSAYIIFSEEEKMQGMSYVPPGNSVKNDREYSETAIWNGIHSRQVYASNIFTLKFDKDFANENEQCFTLVFDYWDYGGGGYFYVDYIPKGSNEVKTLQVLKLGMENGAKTEGRWYRVSINIDDGCFTGRFPDGSDLQIRSGAYNSFSKIEVRNLSRYAGPDDDIGNFNGEKAKVLNNIGFYDDKGRLENFTPDLDYEPTRKEAVCKMLAYYGMDESAVKTYLNTAKSMGIIGKDAEFIGDEKFTQKELIVWYLNLLGIENDENTDVYSVAREYGLLNSGCMIFQPEKTADMDALVCLAVNALTLDHKKTGYNALSECVGKDKVEVKTLFEDASDDAVWNWVKKHPFKLPKQKHVDRDTGRTYYTVSVFGQDTEKSYFTENCVSSDNKKIYANTSGGIIEYNIETEMCRYVSGDYKKGAACSFVVTPLDHLWFITTTGEIIMTDLTTYETKVVTTVPEEKRNSQAWFIQVNDDESLLSTYWEDDVDENGVPTALFALLDLKTLKWDMSHSYTFPTKRTNPSHVCINPNPKYSNYVFFAHEDTGYFAPSNESMNQHDRVWMLNRDTGEYYNVFKQKWTMQPLPGDPTSGRIGEAAGHEYWSPDGEWIGFVRHKTWVYIQDFTIGEGNICMMKPDGTDKWYIPIDITPTMVTAANARAGITHCNVSHDNRWTTGDTLYSAQTGWTDAILVDNYTGKTHWLARVSQSGANPGHYHPQFSHDDRFIVFGLWSDDKSHVQIGWMDVSDLTQNGAEGGRFDLSESCESFSYKGNFKHYVEPLYDSKGAFAGVKIPSGKEMYVDVKKTVVEKDNTPATIKIVYKDDGKTPITLRYYTWNEGAHLSRNFLAEHEYTIKRNGTGKVMAKTIKLDDICLGNMQVLRSDFRIGSDGGSATVLSVDVSVSE